MTTPAIGIQRPRPSGGTGTDRSGYVLLAACIDGHAGAPSAHKRAVLAAVATQRERLRRDLAADVSLLTARQVGGPATTAPPATGPADPARAPGRHAVRVRHWATVDGQWGEVRGPLPASPFDVAVLVRCPTVAAARWLTADPTLLDLRDVLGAAGRGCRLAVLDNLRAAGGAPAAGGARSSGAGPYLLVRHDQRPLRPAGGGESAPLPVWAWPDDRSMRRDLALSLDLRRYAAAARAHVTWYGPA